MVLEALQHGDSGRSHAPIAATGLQLSGSVNEDAQQRRVRFSQGSGIIDHGDRNHAGRRKRRWTWREKGKSRLDSESGDNINQGQAVNSDFSRVFYQTLFGEAIRASVQHNDRQEVNVTATQRGGGRSYANVVQGNG
ncbi:hypothetical protein NE237_006474 [Protea cynaroides]|uniref:Uncharacterized protein n=1 Tax=Protea cynaroides TaxID=273540 RepID=A0A9Q0QV78_9MAGN|nr:hypothetical protein NE237_006474 [Protea cynaroides]